MTRLEALAVHVLRWRDLSAWGRPLSEVTVDVKFRPLSQKRLGRCLPLHRKTVVFDHPKDPVWVTLATGLHELAHAAAPAGEGHGERWQRLLAAAVEEVTEIAVPAVVVNFSDLDVAAERAVWAWWRTTGQDRIWSMLRFEDAT